ncbi:methylmalonyl Co-A mutase-associated GTPase MeaB [Deinococcus irradiatisoli]|uniref:Methylmalonyl Co-A mutase-associated GTPase MeaB n=1 Tax=Deinococcus irradiatisoli TaxID=2202254 RepID=A0A2Z3JIC5_9DEIO|nr:methylmalonyl Co-A mutase-associated GTPase MeaB [Deinococcus irradiatisoli]AWN23756.1 methylmalonyl Co-A mutase-associated GTPase MeaB [Deinococcus irradiatisoli]
MPAESNRAGGAEAQPEVHPLAAPLVAGHRRALARAITLAESSRPDHQQEAQRLLAEVLPHAGRSVRIGLTGVPGVGKSTFIEALGLHLTGAGHKVAVLAVDPSSQRTGGSIMGDKTRMPGLTADPNAFIRPSPSGGALGGVARRTREAITLCEAAGHDVILIETVGVGQSETQVAAMTDVFVLLTLPNAGDELQGLKRGIMERADVCVVNKADTDPAATNRAQSELAAALHLLTPRLADWQPRVLQSSALRGRGLEEVWAAVQDFMSSPERVERKRRAQTGTWFDDLLREAAWERLSAGIDVAELRRTRSQVLAGTLTPVQGVLNLMPPTGA